MNLNEQFAKLAANLMSKVYYKLLTFGTSIAGIFGAGDEDEIATTIGTLAKDLKNGAIDVATNETMVACAYALCALFFLLSLIPFITEKGFTIEAFVKFFAKLAIGVFAVSIAGDIIKYSFQFGNALSDFVADNFTILGSGFDLGQTQEEIQATLEGRFLTMAKEGGGFSLLMTSVFTILPIDLIILVMTIVSYIIAFSRLFEMCIRSAFLPIPLALLSDDGWRGAGGRYIRKLLAIMAQGAVLVAIAMLTSQIMGRVLGTDTLEALESESATIEAMIEKVLIAAGIGISSVSIMFKSIGFVNDIFGA